MSEEQLGTEESAGGSRRPEGRSGRIALDDGSSSAGRADPGVGCLKLEPELAAQNEVIADKIGRDLLAREAALFGSKWFDYRFLHPAEATQRFATEYRVAFKRKHAENFDRDEAELKQGISTVIIGKMTAKELSVIWIARQFADALGVEYRLFINFVMRRCMENGWNRLPQPNQLYNEELIEPVRGEWSEETEASFRYSTEAQYRAENFRGHPIQVAHHAWLIDQIKRRWSRAHLIALVCRQEALLPTSVAEAAFGKEKVEASCLEAIYSDPPTLRELNDKAFRPGCFGVQHARQPDAGPCGICPFSSECASMGAAATEVIAERFGSVEPVEERKRMLARERQRHRRAKMKGK